MKKIFICSPYRGDVERNIQNAKKYCRYVIKLGYIPIAPHLYFTQFLDDEDEEKRERGINFGLELIKDCSELWIFGCPSITDGMIREIKFALENNIMIRRMWF